MKGAKRLHQLYTDEILRRLQDRGVCERLEYTGSAYDGVKVRRNDNDSDLEFDIMVILRCETDLQVGLVIVLSRVLTARGRSRRVYTLVKSRQLALLPGRLLTIGKL